MKKLFSTFIVSLVAFGNIAASCNEKKTTESPRIQDANLNNYFPTGEQPKAPDTLDRGPDAVPYETGTEDIDVRLIEISADKTSFVSGTSAKLRILGITAENAKVDLTRNADFKINDDNVAVMHEKLPGVVVGKTPGKIEVFVKYKALSAAINLSIADITIDKIEITPKTIIVGTDQQFYATAYLSNGTTMDVTADVKWSTGNDLIISKGESGKHGVFKGERSGKTTLGADLGGRIANSSVEAKLMQLSKITVESAASSVLFGTSVQMKAIATYVNGTTGDITGSVTWKSESPNVASVNDELASKGLVSTLFAGNAVIKASFGEVAGTATITVTSISFQSYKFEPIGLRIPKGKKQKLKFFGIFLNGVTQNISTEVIWASQKAFVAGISNAPGFEGEIEAFEVGDTTISATYGQTIQETIVEVTEAAVVEITLKSTAPNVTCGVNNPTITAEGILSDGTTMDITSMVTFSVENPQFATISNDVGNKGKVTTLKAGSTKIIATLLEPTLGVTITKDMVLAINAPILEGLKVAAAYDSLPVGQGQQIYATGIYSCEVLPPVDFTNQVTWTLSNSTFTSILNTAPKGYLSTSGEVAVPAYTTITATKDAFVGNMNLEIRPKEVTSMQIKTIPQNDNVDVGTNKQIYARAVYSDGSFIDITNTDSLPGFTINWTSMQPSFLTMNNDTSKGVVTGVNERGQVQIGATLITPEAKSFTQTYNLQVRSPCATGLREGIFCWFESDLGQSCVEKCGAITNGLYLDADVTYSGSAGTGNNCSNVLVRLGYGSLSKDNQTGIAGVGGGCAVLDAGGLLATRRYTTPDTNGNEKHPNLRRMCSCRN